LFNIGNWNKTILDFKKVEDGTMNYLDELLNKYDKNAKIGGFDKSFTLEEAELITLTSDI
jgi:hypothetical protein